MQNGELSSTIAHSGGRLHPDACRCDGFGLPHDSKMTSITYIINLLIHVCHRTPAGAEARAKFALLTRASSCLACLIVFGGARMLVFECLRHY